MRTKQITTTCSNYLVQNGGKDLAFLFDGFDEYPEKLWENSLIADILKRNLIVQNFSFRILSCSLDERLAT